MYRNNCHPPRALTVAGSDSSGGAGIQADLKTFAAFGVYGSSALCAVTAQNTLGVHAIQEINTDVITAQIDAVMSDIGTDVVKTGMLSSAPIIETVSESMVKYHIEKLVVDPVMVATSGDRLLQKDALSTFKKQLIPLAFVLTPNIPEAEILASMEIKSIYGAREAARTIYQFGPDNVLIKGGHLPGNESVDLLFDGSSMEEFRIERIYTKNTHGTGCTFASAIASLIALDKGLVESITLAKSYVTEAIRNAPKIGSGNGPLNHFFGRCRPV